MPPNSTETSSLLPRSSPPPQAEQTAPHDTELVLSSLHLSVALGVNPLSASHVKAFVLPKISTPDYGVVPSRFASFANDGRLAAYTLRNGKSFARVRNLFICLLVALNFSSAPHWCDKNSSEEGGVDGLRTCEDFFALHFTVAGRRQYTYESFGSPILSSARRASVETSLCSFLVFDLALQIVYLSDGLKNPLAIYWSGHAMNYLSLIYSTTLILLVATYTTTTTAAITLFTFRPFFRILLFVESSPSTLRELNLLFSLIPSFLRVLFLLLALISIYAWFGSIIFSNQTVEGAMHFSSFPSSVWTLWVLSTTANFPNVMLPSYTESRDSVVFFVSFLVVSYYFVMNLMLATVLWNYNKEGDRFKRTLEENIHDNLSAAFDLLDYSKVGYVSKATIQDVFVHLNRFCLEVRHISPVKAELLFSLLDKSGDDEVDAHEFQHFCNVLRLEFDSTDSYKTYLEVSHPNLFSRQSVTRLRHFVLSRNFDWCIDSLLVLNAVVIAVQSKHELIGDQLSGVGQMSQDYKAAFWEFLSTTFTLIYGLEMTLQIGCRGWKRYWEDYRNRFDFVVTGTSLIATALVYSPLISDVTAVRLVKYVLLVRLLRLGRLIIEVPYFRLISQTLLKVSSQAYRMGSVLFCVVCFFDAVGVHLFGGALHRGPSSLNGTGDYVSNNFFAVNYNDFCSGVVSLFALLVVNNWTVQCAALEAATGRVFVTRAFFVAFHICSVLIVNNLVVSFVVGAVVSEWDSKAPEAMGGKSGGRRTSSKEVGAKIPKKRSSTSCTSQRGSTSLSKEDDDGRRGKGDEEEGEEGEDGEEGEGEGEGEDDFDEEKYVGQAHLFDSDGVATFNAGALHSAVGGTWVATARGDRRGSLLRKVFAKKVIVEQT